MTHVDDAIIEAIEINKFLVQFDEERTFMVRAESPAEAYKIAQQARLQ